MATTLVELRQDQWRPYFDFLNKEYAGWAVTIEVLAGELGDQPAASGPPFQGISFETKGSAAGDVLVEVGDIGTPYEVHRISRPRIIRVSDTQPGAEVDIQIESQDGTSRVVRLRRRPELPPAQPTNTAGSSRSPRVNRPRQT